MAFSLNRTYKRWPSKRRWFVKKFWTIEEIKWEDRRHPARLRAMKRARIWVRSKFGAVI